MAFAFQEDQLLIEDREDLLALLRMRFADVPGEIVEELYQINQQDRLQRLILVAANVPTWTLFIEELRESGEPFKLTGERFNPISEWQEVSNT